MIRRFGILSTGFFYLLLAGCNLAPSYQRPSLSLPTTYKEQSGWHVVTGKSSIADADWWRAFNDPVLDALEKQAGENNQNLKAALARYDEANAALAVTGADLLPTVELGADATRQRISETRKSAASTQTASTAGSTINNSSGQAFNDARLGLNVSFDIDLFGRLRNAVTAAGAAAQASREDAAALLLELQAQVAASYFTIRADDAQIDILNQSLHDYQAQLDYTRRRYEGGIALSSDVDQAKTQLNNAQAQREQTSLQRAQNEHALAVLSGVEPSGFTLQPAPFSLKVVQIDAALPSALLERRPDIAAAEQRVIAANAAIGEARAAWYPDINLTGAGGYESEKLKNLISAPSLFWSIGPGLTQPIFEGGRITALNAQARAVYEETVANYRQTVLAADQEVEDNLASVRQSALTAADQQAAADAANRVLVQFNNRYRGGITTYLDVAIQENTMLQTRLALTETQAAQMIADVRLIKALGGVAPQQPLPAK